MHSFIPRTGIAYSIKHDHRIALSFCMHIWKLQWRRYGYISDGSGYYIFIFSLKFDSINLSCASVCVEYFLSNAF